MRKKESSRIRFHYQAQPFAFRNRTGLKHFLLKLFEKERKQVKAINYIFCDDRYLLSLNQQYLQHDTLTDIITFELSPQGLPLVSDVYVSTERVAENASLYGVRFSHELHRVIFHGALHLCGYKDKTADQARQMRQAEERCLNNYFVSRETVNRKP